MEFVHASQEATARGHAGFSASPRASTRLICTCERQLGNDLRAVAASTLLAQLAQLAQLPHIATLCRERGLAPFVPRAGEKLQFQGLCHRKDRMIPLNMFPPSLCFLPLYARLSLPRFLFSGWLSVDEREEGMGREGKGCCLTILSLPGEEFFPVTKSSHEPGCPLLICIRILWA